MNHEEGVITISFIGIFMVALALMALVIDLGGYLYAKHEAQLVADAGALAGTTAVSVAGVYDDSDTLIQTIPRIDESMASRLVQEVIQENVNARKLNVDRNTKYVGVIKKRLTDTSYYVEVELSYTPSLLSQFSDAWDTLVVKKEAVAEVK